MRPVHNANHIKLNHDTWKVLVTMNLHWLELRLNSFVLATTISFLLLLLLGNGHNTINQINFFVDHHRIIFCYTYLAMHCKGFNKK